MSKSNTFENEVLAHFFQNANIPNIGDATGLRGSTVPGNLYLSLHTADPGEAGTAATNEISYTGYARKAVSRNGAAGFTLTGSQVTLTTDNDFPKMTGGAGGTATHFAVVKEAAGASVVCYKGPCSPTIAVALGIIPRLEAGTSITED